MTLSDEVKRLLDGANFAHLATLMPDDGRVGLSLVDFANPYEEIQIRGHVVERRPDGDLAIMDRISHKYTGAPFPRRDPAGRIVLVVEADRVRHHVLPFRHTPARS